MKTKDKQAPGDEGAEIVQGSTIESFSHTLARHNIDLKREVTHTLQINMGLLCNQACRHCHLTAGPGRKEIMSRETIDQTIAYARRCRFSVIDITGGSPEMNPHLGYLMQNVAPLTSRLMLRSNLTIIREEKLDELVDICRNNRVVIVASFPSPNSSQTEAQRGTGVFETSINTLKMLNELGYGREGSGLELNLVSNPAGAFLPAPQAQAEKKFRRDLERKWSIVFNQLFTFANVPLGRFRTWLKVSGNFDAYLQKLANAFNPCTIESLMCRTLVSVSWDGYLFDCDFNLARTLYLGGRKIHISQMQGPPEPGAPVATGDHCYACTAGTGFT